MAKSRFATFREGDTIIIRLPLELMKESLAHARGAKLAFPVTVADPDKFLDRMVASLNAGSAVEGQLGCEVEELLENRDRCVTESGSPIWRAA